MNRLVDAAQKVLKFQYRYEGYDRFVCSSCGQLQYGDTEFGIQPRGEKCSPNCPWRVLREAVEATGDTDE